MRLSPLQQKYPLLSSILYLLLAVILCVNSIAQDATPQPPDETTQAESDATKTAAKPLPGILKAIEETRPKGASSEVHPEVIQKVSRLLDLTLDSVEAEREKGWTGLKEMGNLAVPGLLAYYRENDPETKKIRSILLALENSKDPRAGPMLMEMLDSKHRIVRQDAARALGASRYKESIPALLQRVKMADEHEAVRQISATSAARLGSEEGLLALCELLKSKDPSIRTRAVFDLGKFGGTRFVEQILPLIKDPDELVRMDAVEALRFAGGDTVRSGLIQATYDRDYKIRSAAMDALRQITGQRFGNEPATWQQWWASIAAEAADKKEDKPDAAEVEQKIDR